MTDDAAGRSEDSAATRAETARLPGDAAGLADLPGAMSPEVARADRRQVAFAGTHRREDGLGSLILPLAGLLVGVLLGLVLNVTVSFELSRYSAVAILAALDSVLGAVRAELDGVYDNRIFISGFVTNAIVAVILTFIGDRLSLDLYLVALINFGFRIFNNVALIRRHYI